MRDQFFGEKTYAQHGDDLMLLNIFWLLGIKHPSYLDIGAHHPHNISNTALLYARGSRGVNVEANPNLIENFKRDRPGDKNINIGVGPTVDVLPFYMFDDFSGRNTFSFADADKFSKEYPNFKIRETKLIEVTTINQIVSNYCDGIWPDLLTMDVEGFDYTILHSAHILKGNQPKVICVEAFQGQHTIKLMMQQKGYFCYCRMVSNLIFVPEEYREKLY